MAPAQSGSPISAPASHLANEDIGPFMLTLCSLQPAAAVQIPRAPQLERFRFFTTRARQSDGTERRYLHMGYFQSLAEAQQWAQLMRSAYPNALATLVPEALLRHPDSGVPTLAPIAQPRGAPASPSRIPAPVAADALTDTQVLTVLETRGASPGQERRAAIVGAEISLLRPEDTHTRRVIKEAVVQGAPVCFAVQLLWSAEPIDLASVPTVSIFRAYTLYVTEAQRDGRSWHCLRLGFFSDAISAKQVAYFVRSTFASVAVLPVTEQERARANETPVAPASLADPFRQTLDQTLAADQRRSPPNGTLPQGSPPPRLATEPVASKSTSDQRAMSSAKSPSASSSRPARRPGGTLEDSLDMLAASEIWESEESMTETGVRHLNVQVQKAKGRRS